MKRFFLALFATAHERELRHLESRTVAMAESLAALQQEVAEHQAALESHCQKVRELRARFYSQEAA